MLFTPLDMQGAYLIQLEPKKDKRGFLVRSFCLNEIVKFSGNFKIVQINQTLTKQKGTIRGLHFQNSSYSEAKIVRCIRGKVFDVLVDLRKNSQTFLKCHGEILSADNMKSLLIPKGFAHGFQTLEDDCEMLYFHDNFYNKDAEGGLRFSDSKIGVNWKLPVTYVSERDKNHPLLGDDYEGVNL
ncbi:MAG: dTDP-4-dehydrorhamnose 3,5-epimerase family protein [Lactobacillales bacterium]|jgi:dTDP-4-dehydrorhamnose 3,5-epimerase|nr:dTDP-4-dehydrorhamnose 3,5-epimerase family protein [Lactobacillales bacterium]